ncbi:hypothetical protein BDV93DRAFT_516901 [Ceratobasidium sp. AG-I]|nr:hypothetical protein BDV93DRAFT_516901 [Ceratobasidium sp. AG-I]
MPLDKVAAATINLLLSSGRIYYLDVPRLYKRFDVKEGNMNTFGGVLYYDDTDDLSGNQAAVVSSSEGKLVVEFTKRNKVVARYTSSESFPDPIAPVNNGGAWVDIQRG